MSNFIDDPNKIFSFLKRLRASNIKKHHLIEFYDCRVIHPAL